MAIEIKQGIPGYVGRRVPNSNLGQLRKAISEMKVMESKESDQYFDWSKHQQGIHLAASQVGAEVKTEKINGGGYRVWRVK